ncbi:hypothetical protein BT69DRAFT_1313388 [Atractiella rhizophila]|nr:hypothetical protein BT69DRAFT_1313388 [Atractiella rhizophila]
MSSSPMLPTWNGTVSTFEDACTLILAVRKGLLPEVKRKLNKREKAELIRPGNVFVFEEGRSGVVRWNDHLKWYGARYSGCFILYDERPDDTSNTQGMLTRKTVSVNCAGTDERYHVIAYLDGEEKRRVTMDDRLRGLVVNVADFSHSRSAKRAKEEPEDDLDGLPTIKSPPKRRQSTGSVAVIHAPPAPQQSKTPPTPIPTPQHQPEKLKQIPSLPQSTDGPQDPPLPTPPLFSHLPPPSSEPWTSLPLPDPTPVRTLLIPSRPLPRSESEDSLASGDGEREAPASSRPKKRRRTSNLSAVGGGEETTETLVEKEEKAEERRRKNALAARKCRAQKASYIESLEKRLAEATSLLGASEKEREMLKTENERLRLAESVEEVERWRERCRRLEVEMKALKEREIQERMAKKQALERVELIGRDLSIWLMDQRRMDAA